MGPAADYRHPYLVFVYGTLKRGGANHSFLAGQRFVGLARHAPGMTLYSLGDYPGMVADPSDREGVVGEVWAVDPACLEALDALEGVAEGLYARRPADLIESPLPAAAGGGDHTANQPQAIVETYLYLGDTRGCPHVGASWPVNDRA